MALPVCSWLVETAVAWEAAALKTISTLIEREIQLQHIHAGLAEETELASRCVLLDQLANRVLVSARAPSRRAEPGSRRCRA